MFTRSKNLQLPTADEALPGRSQAMPVAERHAVLGTPMIGPWPGTELAVFAMGCFWGAERLFYETGGVVVTAAGYAGGHTANPTYGEVCSGATGHTEVVLVAFRPEEIDYRDLLSRFWEGHDPTQGMRQGNDVGTQYRSAIYTSNDRQARLARDSRDAYQKVLADAGYGEITTEIQPLDQFFYAEDHHQQYLHKNPGGYCGLGGTGLSCPTGTGV